MGRGTEGVGEREPQADSKLSMESILHFIIQKTEAQEQQIEYVVKKIGFGVIHACVRIPALPSTCCVTLGMLLHVSELQFPYL